MFAKKAAISFRGIQLLERSDHDWRRSSMKKVAGALGLPPAGIDMLMEQFMAQHEDSVMATSVRIRSDGVKSWPLHLFTFVDSFRSAPSESAVASTPLEALDVKIRALLASTVEMLCAEQTVSIPEWCYGVRCLRQPWFVAGVESLKATALVESPVRFRKRNIFVLGNFLDRA